MISQTYTYINSYHDVSVPPVKPKAKSNFALLPVKFRITITVRLIIARITVMLWPGTGIR